MKDKEVGELWREVQLVLNGGVGTAPTDHYHNQAMLICKLVEERAKHKSVCWPGSPQWTCFIDEALRDFSIPPETWNKT